MRYFFLAAAFVLMFSSFALAEAPLAEGVRHVDDYTLTGEKNFLSGYAAQNSDGTVNVVVEIPTGDLSKWEVRSDGNMIWELKNGKPRVVKYLGYPGNYGMVPSTLGGDTDPLDIIVLGPAQPRGAVIKVKLLGVLLMMDDGEVDDKLVAAVAGSPLAEAKDLTDLESKFAGSTKILTLWFENYKGKGKMQIKGMEDAAKAEGILKAAMAKFVAK